MSQKPGRKVKVALFEIDPTWLGHLNPTLKGSDIVSRTYDDDAFSTPIEDADIILCGQPKEQVTSKEVGQSMRMLYPDHPIYFMASQRAQFDRKLQVKNGFTDAFLVTADAELASATLTRDITRLGSTERRSFRSIQLIDVVPDSVLGFDLYLHLPANNRKIRYVPSTESLGEKRSEKLKKHQLQSAMVPEDQIQKFYDFTARQLKAIDSNKSMSETEKQEKRATVIRDLLSGVFNGDDSADSIEHGREIMTDCQEIVKSYIVDPGAKTNWYDKLMEFSNSENNAYNHAANTATFASLLSYALGIGDPKELALAALLHDVGMVDVPAEILAKKESERTPEETAKYQSHPLLSVNLVKQRKMIVSENVLLYIEQHHERHDGTGYPNKLTAPRLKKESQVLHIADRIDELTAPQEGVPRISIKTAIERICDESLGNPSQAAIEPSLAIKLKATFLDPQKKVG